MPTDRDGTHTAWWQSAAAIAQRWRRFREATECVARRFVAALLKKCPRSRPYATGSEDETRSIRADFADMWVFSRLV
eukprot:1570094-Pleurochrysis_carterae.AAC.1